MKRLKPAAFMKKNEDVSFDVARMATKIDEQIELLDRDADKIKKGLMRVDAQLKKLSPASPDDEAKVEELTDALAALREKLAGM